MFSCLFSTSCAALGDALIDIGIGTAGTGIGHYNDGVEADNQKQQKDGANIGLLGGLFILIGKALGGRSRGERGLSPMQTPDIIEPKPKPLNTNDKINLAEANPPSVDTSPVEAVDFTPFSNLSSVTQTSNAGQNNAEPQVNNVATPDRVILPGNRDPRRSNRGNRGNQLRNQNRPSTGRDSVSAHQNAGNRGSRVEAANKRPDYVQNPSQPTPRPPANQGSVTSPKPLPTILARAAEVNAPNPAPAPSPASTATKIADYTPPKPPQNNPTPPQAPIKTPPPPAPAPQPKPEPKTDQTTKTGGYEPKNEAVRLSCERLSPTGKQILSAIDGVAKELSVTIWITDGDRPWKDQLVYLLERPKEYPGTTESFKKTFMKDPPKTASELTEEQEKWYQERIISQAGKSPGFAHVGNTGVGGSAVDIRVSDFSINGKKRLDELLTAKGIKILYEDENGKKTTRNNAKVFHLHK